MFELHIEQGPILEAEQKVIGIVTGVQGMRWYEIELTGREAHTGSTPMNLRKNALLGAARVVEQVDRIALEHAPSAVGTVGLVEVKPNSRNVIPGHVFFTVDFRHPDDAVLDVMERELFEAVPAVAAEIGLEPDVKKVWDSPAVRFDPDCIAAVRTGIEKVGPSCPRDGFRRRPRRRLYRAGRPHHDDLRPLRRRPQPQRGREHHVRRMLGRSPGSAERRPGIRPALQQLSSPAYLE